MMMCASVSISTDGRVLEWNLKKGLVMSKLMDLKKSGTVRLSSPLRWQLSLKVPSDGGVLLYVCVRRATGGSPTRPRGCRSTSIRKTRPRT